MRLEVLPPAEWAGAVADEWMARLRDRPALRMCLPTGDTPRPLYHELAARGPDLSGTEVFLLDEFLDLAPGNPVRCDVMFQRDFTSLFDRIGAIDRLDPDAADLDAEMERYEAAVAAGGLDLTMLGLGRNGHVALNEPGSLPEERTRVVDLHPTTIRAMVPASDVLPHRGLTLGLGNILESREVWLLVTGAAKAEVLAAALEGPIDPMVPAGYLRNHDRFVVFADEAAAGALGPGGQA
jgi:glucosamine-6-phosphate deaminase